jgi:hypothetical protein
VLKQPGDPEERRGGVRIMLSELVQPGQVSIDEQNNRRAPPGYPGKGQVVGRRDGPRIIDRFRHCLEVPAPGRRLPVGQQPAQRIRLEGGGRHALAVDRVEGAHRVTQDEEAIGEVPHPFVVLPDVRRIVERDRVVQRDAGPDRLGDVREPQARDELLEALRIGRRVIAEQPGGGQQEPVLRLLQASGPRVVGSPDVHDQPVLAQYVRRQPVAPGRVGDVDGHLLRDRPAVAQFLQPHRRAGGAPGRVHDQVGVDDFLGPALGSDPDPGHPPLVGRSRRPGNVVAVEKGHATEALDRGPDVRLEHRPAGEYDGLADVGLGEAVPGQEPANVAEQVTDRGTGLGDLLGQAGEQLVEHLPAAAQQRVQVPSLRNAAALIGIGAKHIALDDGDLPERLA